MNESSDKVEAPFQKWSWIIGRFCSVGPCAFQLKWDVRDAFPVFPVREQDRPLTMSHLPGFGWFYRAAGDFGGGQCLVTGGSCWAVGS